MSVRISKLLKRDKHEQGPRGRHGKLTPEVVADVGDELLVAYQMCPDVVTYGHRYERLQGLIEWTKYATCELAGDEARTVMSAFREAVESLRRRNLSPEVRDKRIKRLYRACTATFGRLAIHEIDEQVKA